MYYFVNFVYFYKFKKSLNYEDFNKQTIWNIRNLSPILYKTFLRLWYLILKDTLMIYETLQKNNLQINSKSHLFWKYFRESLIPIKY